MDIEKVCLQWPLETLNSTSWRQASTQVQMQGGQIWGGGPLSEIEMMDGEMDQRASCINEDSLLLGSSIWPANMRYVPWRTNKQHTPNAGHTNVLFKFTFPSQILPYRLITSTRTVACHKSQTSSPPSMLFHMECGQGGLPKIKMNMRGPGRWQSC